MQEYGYESQPQREYVGSFQKLSVFHGRFAGGPELSGGCEWDNLESSFFLSDHLLGLLVQVRQLELTRFRNSLSAHWLLAKKFRM